MAALMRARGVPLWSLESGEPVRDAALWGFTLQHELTYTNILEMLDLAAVPLHAAERGEGDPIVLGGGPGSANPLPLTPFFDAFFVGEAEGRLAAIAAALEAPTRARRLEQLGLVPGVWLPHAPRRGAGRASAARSSWTSRSTPPVSAPLVPLIEGVHDRAVIEVMRGCSSGCRFCQAGLWYRPVRERPAAMVVDAAERALRATGCDEVSLISLSSCDYGGVREAVAGIRERFPHVRVSLPSLRVDSAAVGAGAPGRRAARLGHAGARGRHPAPARRHQQARRPAGLLGGRARRLRGRLQRSEAVLHGRPAGRDRRRRGGHRRHGVDGRCPTPAPRRRGRARVSIAVSSFVPKAHTPFERAGFAGEAVIRHRQELLRSSLPRQIRVRFPRRGHLARRGHHGHGRRRGRRADRSRLARRRAVRRLERVVRRRHLAAGRRRRGHRARRPVLGRRPTSCRG